MHRLFRKRLDDATGISEFVIALSLDIRGFSDWSLEVDSAQTALYIKKIYAKLIDGYFAHAALVKPTGDGLLVVQNFDEDDVGSAVTEVVESSLEIVKSFGSLCDEEPAINFAVPSDVGIGIARGAASRLASKGTTLDYSGRVLNLSSRLMDMARPRGIVFDERFGFELLPKKLKGRFKREEIFLKGVSPRKPLGAYFWPKTIEPPPGNLFPIGKPRWEHVLATVSREELSGSGRYIMDLPNHPPDPSTLTCLVTHDEVTKSRKPSTEYETTFEFPVEFADRAGVPQAHIDQPSLVSSLQRGKVGLNWPVSLKVSYRLA